MKRLHEKNWEIFESFGSGCSREFAHMQVNKDSGAVVISQRTINGNYVLQSSPTFRTWRVLVDGRILRGGLL